MNYALKSEVVIMFSYAPLIEKSNFFAKDQVASENASEKHDKASGEPYHTITN